MPFVEGGLKRRVRKVLTLKKTTFWRYVVSLVAVVLMAVLFLTTPVLGVPQSPVSQFLPNQAQPTEPVETTLPEQTQPTEPRQEETKPAPTKPAETKPTKPAPTEPVETKPAATESTTPAKPAKPTVSGVIPAVVQNGASAPGADTPTHSHAYTMRVQTPTCLEIGYTVNTCACGHVYYNGYRSAFGHSWTLIRSSEATVMEDGGNYYQCAKCDLDRWEVTALAGYKTFDLPGVDKEVTAYAAKRGFQTMESHANRNVECYTLCWDMDQVYRYGGRDYLIEEGKSFVKRAESDCKDQGREPSECVIWVELVMDNSVILRVYCAV